MIGYHKVGKKRYEQLFYCLFYIKEHIFNSANEALLHLANIKRFEPNIEHKSNNASGYYNCGDKNIDTLYNVYWRRNMYWRRIRKE
jgi:hypothetical protein